jgi:glycosyltransferase involved in cell wall biosynthesis
VIVHVFNSGSVSGPETLVLPALAELELPVAVVFLRERRLGERGEDPLRFARDLGLHVREVAVDGRFDRRAARALGRELLGLGAQIVHAHDVKASIYTLLAVARWRRRPKLVSTHHGVHGRPDLRTRAYEQLYSRLALRFFERGLCVSRADERELLARGLRPGRLRLHPNGADAPLVHPAARPAAAARVRAAWGLPADLPLLGMVARFSTEKRHPLFLRALAELERRDPRLRWLAPLFGGGPLRELCEAQARALGLEGRVRFMGYRPGVGAELAGVDLLCFVSSAEGLPVSAIEAGWAGTPILSTSVGGLTDLLEGGAGVLVRADPSPTEIATALHGLVTDGARRAALGMALQQRVAARHSRRRWLDDLRNIYQELS